MPLRTIDVLTLSYHTPIFQIKVAKKFRACTTFVCAYATFFYEAKNYKMFIIIYLFPY